MLAAPADASARERESREGSRRGLKWHLQACQQVSEVENLYSYPARRNSYVY